MKFKKEFMEAHPELSIEILRFFYTEWLESHAESKIESLSLRKTAENIVEELFTNVRGEKARRLVLELDGSDGGGWAKEPMLDVIIRHLEGR